MPTRTITLPVLALACLAPLLACARETDAGPESAPSPVTVDDPSFELADGAGGPRAWVPCVIGPSPAVTLDREMAKDGKASLRISSKEPTDAAMQQHVRLSPGELYILRGWVKTRDLAPGPGSDVHGTLAVMTPGGAGEGSRIAAGKSLPGTSDWTRIDVPFDAPPDGRVRILCFLCGWGKGTGTAWFDGLELVPAGNLPVAVSVTREVLVEEPISDLLCGNFIESGFGRQVDGLWADLLWNRSFEEVPPLKSPVWDWLGRGPSDDLSKEDWWHSGYEERPWRLAGEDPDAALAPSRHWDFHHGMQALRIENRSRERPAALAQDGIVLRRGISYRFRGSLRSGEAAARDAPKVDVKIGLYEEGRLDRPIAEAALPDVGSEWREREAIIENPAFEGRATFALTVGAGAAITADAFSLVPGNAVQGWRREVVEALRRVNPRIIRFPGGCYASFYHWRDGIGPRAERRPRESEYWGGLEENDVGTAELVALCREIGAEPFLCVNVMTGTAAEAAEWVAYSNGAGDRGLGALRKSHGHADPFGVKYWELDNETYRKYGPLEYAARCVEFSRAMKAEDPTIRLVMVGYWRYHESLEEMLEIAGEHIDLVTDRGMDEAYLRRVLAIIRAHNERRGTRIRLCNTEWIAPLSDVPVFPDALNRQPAPSELTLQNRQIRWRYAMNAARQVLEFQGLGGELVFTNFNNLANTWGQNVIECSKEKVWLSATGRVFELLSRSPAAWPLRLEAAGPHPGVVVRAAWSRDRDVLVIDAINYRRSAVQAQVNISALGIVPRAAEVVELSAPSPASFNSAREEAVVRTERRLDLPAAPGLSLELPPFSVVEARIRRDGAPGTR